VTATSATPLPAEAAFRQAFDPLAIGTFADRLSAIGSYELGFRPAGTEAGHQAGQLIAAEMERIGLQRVRREPFPVYAWDFGGASLRVAGHGRTIPASSFPPTPGTGPAGLAALLVDVGLGTAADYAGRNVADKLVYARLDVDVMRWPGVLVHEAELHGAAGVVFSYLNGYAQHPSGAALNTHDGMCRDAIPLVQVSVDDGRALAALLAEQGQVEVVLTSHVRADPAGTGYNVIGEIPGQHTPNRYLVVGAHYDAWFTGYWDNAIGVAAMLAIARALVDSGYRPAHTLVFVATDAEEFGAPDSIFDWLVGAHALLEAHPEWHGRTTCCFNFDTLSLRVAQGLRFYGSAEMAGFVRPAIAGPEMRLRTFPQPQATMDAYVTPWTETYSWTYFGVPVLQPSFDRGRIGETHYHTQFDQREIVDLAKSNEAVQLYGSLLIRLDGQPLAPYDFTPRAQALRASVDWSAAAEFGLADRLAEALDLLQDRAGRLSAAVEKTNARGWGGLAGQTAAVTAANDELRQVAAYVLHHCSYLGGDFCHTVMGRHEASQGQRAALQAAISSLQQGDAAGALAALTDKKAGLPGAFFGRHASEATYRHFTVEAIAPGRPHLLWGAGRALPTVDCWAILQQLAAVDPGPALAGLQAHRRAVTERLRQDLLDLAQVAEIAAGMLPVHQVEALVA
jgi:hypothetical protein